MSHLIVLVVFTILLGLTQAKPTLRILNGSKANFTQFAHQVSLRYKHDHCCGGSIISRRSILTAAHCLVDLDGTTILSADDFTVRAGTINRIAGGVIVQAKGIKIHRHNDIALLELEEDLPFSKRIQPIELFADEVPPDSDIIISGWGKTLNGATAAPIYLQYLFAKSLSKLNCDKELAAASTESLICVKHEEDAGACYGDSGGPATYKGKLVGVANFVIETCGSRFPDGYAKVAYNIDWIRRNMV